MIFDMHLQDQKDNLKFRDRAMIGAMQALITRLNPNRLGNNHIDNASTALPSSQEVANQAFAFADALMKKRQEMK